MASKQLAFRRMGSSPHCYSSHSDTIHWGPTPSCQGGRTTLLELTWSCVAKPVQACIGKALAALIDQSYLRAAIRPVKR